MTVKSSGALGAEPDEGLDEREAFVDVYLSTVQAVHRLAPRQHPWAPRDGAVVPSSPEPT